MEILALSGALTVERLASELGTSNRTLQRRLREQDLTFRDAQAHVRLKVAHTLLCETETAVQDIAARLGYRKPGAFARAFTRWTGQSPSAYRYIHRLDNLARSGQDSGSGRS
ncbi:helix-turn-helix transcriptional regulator [Acuticoccus kandeliae]|uniref:helix-turn-helix transcriptional regulator n=1 Tax=Acuticoccus kandeliae TaxID=2073160 RepID=UPI00130091B6|nr:helix-turn-helix transcriptional regulator [Acuticoccus kandeliae]